MGIGIGAFKIKFLSVSTSQPQSFSLRFNRLAVGEIEQISAIFTLDSLSKKMLKMAILNIAVVALLSEPTSLSIDTVCQCKGITASEYLEPYSSPCTRIISLTRSVISRRVSPTSYLYQSLAYSLRPRLLCVHQQAGVLHWLSV